MAFWRRCRILFVSSETLTSGMAQPCCWRYGRVALQRRPLSQTPFSWRRQDNGNPKAPVAGRNTAELRCVGVRVTPVFPHFLRHQPDHERQQDRQGNAEEQAIGQAKHENADSQRNAIFSKTFVPNHPAERTKPPFDLAIAVHPTASLCHRVASHEAGDDCGSIPSRPPNRPPPSRLRAFSRRRAGSKAVAARPAGRTGPSSPC